MSSVTTKIAIRRRQPKDLITTAEARELLQVSRPKMAQLLKDNLVFYPDPLDRRVKLVSRAEVMALKSRGRAA